MPDKVIIIGGGQAGAQTAISLRAGGFDGAVDELVASIARGGPGSRRAITDDINRQLRPHDFRVFQRSIMNPEMREGMTAFLEKRDPVWPRD